MSKHDDFFDQIERRWRQESAIIKGDNVRRKDLKEVRDCRVEVPNKPPTVGPYKSVNYIWKGFRVGGY